MRRVAFTLLVLACVSLLCCSWVERDKCWISEMKYAEAKRIYEETAVAYEGTEALEKVREQLEKAEWRPGEINQAIYRLGKEYHLEEASP